jgi:hypothetical protein
MKCGACRVGEYGLVNECNRCGARAALPPVRSEPTFALPIVVLDAHNDELEIRKVYMAERDDGSKELVIATNAEPEQ